jgi:hypothetical protein
MNQPIQASNIKLLVGTGISALIAGALLIAVVLPAEYDLDPTGIGAGLGIKGMSPAAEEEAHAEPSVSDPSSLSLAAEPIPQASQGVADATSLWARDTPYRSDELSLTLAPNEGAEIKALMKAGERFVFTWTASGGLVNFDLHGEPLTAKSNEFTSYLKGRSAADGHGAFVAPFDGTHGWFWRNRGTHPVTISVKTSGFYEKLYRP